MIGNARPPAAFFLAAAILSPLAAPVAQAWEFAYGPPKTSEQGFRRVAPVLRCPGGGYIAVGTLELGSANSDAYAVRTDGSGWPLWEFVYDVGKAGLADEGVAIGEDDFGFVFLSNSRDRLGGYPALTRIGCDGQPLWSWIYRSLEEDLTGRDLLRSVNGDWVVAGVFSQGTLEDGFLMRTDPAGTKLWDHTYQAYGREAFYAVAEATRLPGQALPDLVAVGRYSVFGGDQQGLVARVAGDTGTMLGPSHCLAHHGLPQVDEVYESVVRLRTPPAIGQIAMTGSATDEGSGQTDIWVVHGDSCAILAQSRIGGRGVEVGYDLREVLVGSPAVPAGSLAIAGAHRGNLGVDAALVFLTLGPPLQVISGNLFGDFAAGAETFYSLAESGVGAPPAPGFILAGFTESDWDGFGDPRDLYLVHYDPAGPACHQSWSPRNQETFAPAVQLPKRLHVGVFPQEVQTAAKAWTTPFPICQ